MAAIIAQVSVLHWHRLVNCRSLSDECSSLVQRSAKRLVRGLVKFVPAS